MPAGHSDLYSPLIAALRLVGERAADPAVSRAAIILVTDGQGRSAADLRLLRRAWEEAPAACRCRSSWSARACGVR